MVLKKKISEKELQDLREEVISHAGHVTEDVKEKKKPEKVRFDIFIEKRILREIEEALTGGLTTKSAFILQAIHEKLNRKE